MGMRSQSKKERWSVAKSKTNGTTVGILADLPPRAALEERLRETVIEGKRIAALLDYLDRVAEIESGSARQDLEEVGVGLDELEGEVLDLQRA
jgi:hypothetical protein